MPDLLTTFATTPWRCEIDASINRAMARRADHEYLLSTVEIVERGRDPSNPRKPLTVSALKAWVERCLTAPTEDHTHVAQHPPSRVTTPRRVLPHDGPRGNA